jgi:molybdopterin converting factor small subunit
MAVVYLPSSLTVLFPGAPRRLCVEAATVHDLIDVLNEQWPGLRSRVCDAGPVIRQHVNIFVDGEKSTLATPVALSSEVHIIPAVSGG